VSPLQNVYSEFLARVGSFWPNEGAVVRRLWLPACTARTENFALGCKDICAPSFRVCTWPDLPIEPMQYTSVTVLFYPSKSGSKNTSMDAWQEWRNVPSDCVKWAAALSKLTKLVEWHDTDSICSCIYQPKWRLPAAARSNIVSPCLRRALWLPWPWNSDTLCLDMHKANRSCRCSIWIWCQISTVLKQKTAQEMFFRQG